MHLVRIRIADAGRIALHAEEIIDNIPQYYADQYRRIKRKQEADQELAAGFLLEKYLDVSRDGQLVRLGHGKPAMKSGKHYFNLSHSGGYAVLAAADIDIGVDIEQIRDVHWPTVRKVFTLQQREQLEQAGEMEQPELFTKYWTECEAVLKLQGTGFAEGITPGNARGGSTEPGSTEPGSTEPRSTEPRRTEPGNTEPGNTEPGNTESEGRRLLSSVHSFRFKEYMIACAAYGEFYVSVEEDRSYLYM